MCVHAVTRSDLHHILFRAARRISIRAGRPVTPLVMSPAGRLYGAYSSVCVCVFIILSVWLSHASKPTHMGVTSASKAHEDVGRPNAVVSLTNAAVSPSVCVQEE